MDTELVVVEQRELTFYDDQLVAVRAADGHVYVSVRHLCEAIGVARQPQVRRITEHHVLSKGYAGGTIMIPPGPQGGGGSQKAGLLRADLVPLWLSGIDTKRVKEEIRQKLERYQEEVGAVLWEAFREGRLTAAPSFDELLAGASPETVQAYQVAQAVLHLARNQVMLEAQLRGVLDNHEQRLEAVEAQLRLDSARYVTEEQASMISQAVKAVAVALGKRSGRNEFGGVYGEMYRKFGISGYKMLPARRFEEAMRWLTEWRDSVEGGLPF